MNKAKFGGVPPKTQNLPNGKYRVYLNPVMTKEINTIVQMDSDEVIVEEFDSYICDELDLQDVPTYESIVDALIRTKYTISGELAIIRQRESKPEEFAAYNIFAESCKAIAKEWDNR
ncbi:MAG: hypothetical protein ACI4TU_09975 [Candidatus Cryptobacteroides sp.]